MNRSQKNIAIRNKIELRTGIALSWDQVDILRRADMALHRWYELECGTGNDTITWVVERDEDTGRPYMMTHLPNGKITKHRYPDYETGAIKRIEQVCNETGLHYYLQTDPRGCALHVSNEPLDDRNYSSRGIVFEI